MGEVGVDVGQQVTHHRGNAGAHVLRGQTGEMPGRDEEEEEEETEIGRASCRERVSSPV